MIYYIWGSVPFIIYFYVNFLSCDWVSFTIDIMFKQLYPLNYIWNISCNLQNNTLGTAYFAIKVINDHWLSQNTVIQIRNYVAAC